MKTTTSSIGLYFHLPYCIKKCPYCDFNSYSITEGEYSSAVLDKGLGDKESDYIDALIREIEHYKSQADTSVVSIFFGGGTPSLFSATGISQILDAARSAFQIETNAEISLEVNPGSVFEPLNTEKLRALKHAGINRLSFGCQSFSQRKLDFLGRVHTVSHIEAAIENAVAAGFENYSVDLIFGTKDETIDEWMSDIDRALALKPKHISAYGLTIEPGTDFGKWQKKGATLVCEEGLFADMYTEGAKMLSSAGFSRYEISNYATPDYECRHNLNYWARDSYLGFGAGAHSFLKGSEKWGKRWINEVKPARYVQRCLEESHARQRLEEVSKDEAVLEKLFLSLRTTYGLNLEKFAEEFDSPPPSQNLKELIGEELLISDKGVLRLTEKGFLFSDHIFERLS